MAIAINSPGTINPLNPIADLNQHYGPYVSIAAACLAIPEALRAKGKTVGIVQADGKVVNFWWNSDDLTDSGLVEKINQFDTISLIAGNDASVDVFSESYLTSHSDWGILKVGQMVENSQQLATKTLTGWKIENKNALSFGNLNLSDPLIWSGAAGAEVLDISSVNTADFLVLTEPSPTVIKDVFSIIGGVNNRMYRIIGDGTLSVNLKHNASPTSNSIVTKSGADVLITPTFSVFQYMFYQVINREI